jgi:hypothetical protein
VNQGGVFVSVDSSATVDRETVRQILHSGGGHSSSQARSAIGGALDGHDDPTRGPLDRTANALGMHDDPNRGPLDRAANALSGHDDPNRGPLDRAANALDGALAWRLGRSFGIWRKSPRWVVNRPPSLGAAHCGYAGRDRVMLSPPA